MTRRVTVIERELKRGEASLNILPPLLLKERRIQGVRLKAIYLPFLLTCNTFYTTM